MNGNTRALPDGTPMSYDINVVSGWSDWVSSVQIIAQNLADLGIEAKVQTYDFAAYFDHLPKGDFDLSIWSGQIGPTPYTYYRNVMGSVMVVAGRHRRGAELPSLRQPGCRQTAGAVRRHG